MSGNIALKIPLQDSIRNWASIRANDFQQRSAQAIPCHVTKVDKDFVTVAFETKNNVYTMPTVKIPQSFSSYAREPTQVGDKGYAVPSNYYLGGVSGDAGGNTNFFPRGNLTTLSFQPISQTANPSRDYDQYTVTGGPNGVKIIQSGTQSQQPNPLRMAPATVRRLRGMSTAAKRAWRDRNPVATPVIPRADSKAYMQIDKNGVILHSSADGNHQVGIDQSSQKVYVKAPASETVFLGGDGTEGQYDFVATMSGPSINVKARYG